MTCFAHTTEGKRLWRQANPEKVRAQKKRHHAKHRDRLNTVSRQYAADHASEAVERTRRWREAHPERYRAANREVQARRRARLRGCEVEKVDPQIVWERDEGVCGICGDAADYADWHMDHVIPISKGGPHVLANVQVSHPSCNCSKGAR